MYVNTEVFEIVLRVGDPFSDGRIDATAHHHRRERRVCDYRLTHHDVAPRRGHAIGANADLSPMKMHRPIEATADVVFASPHLFDGGAAEPLGDFGCFALDMRVRHGPSPKSTAGHLSMKDDLIGLEAERLRNGNLIEGLKLRTDPGLGPVTIKADGRVEWLHRRMRQVRKIKVCNDANRLTDSFNRFFVSPRQRAQPFGSGKLLVFRPQRSSVFLRNFACVPVNLESIACLLCRPEFIGDYRDA